MKNPVSDSISGSTDRTMPYLQREEKQDQLQYCALVLGGLWTSPSRTVSLTHPSCAVVEGTSSGVDQVPYDAHPLSRDKRTLVSGTGKDIPTQGNSLAQAIWALHLLIRI